MRWSQDYTHGTHIIIIIIIPRFHQLDTWSIIVIQWCRGGRRSGGNIFPITSLNSCGIFLLLISSSLIRDKQWTNRSLFDWISTVGDYIRVMDNYLPECLWNLHEKNNHVIGPRWVAMGKAFSAHISIKNRLIIRKQTRTLRSDTDLYPAREMIDTGHVYHLVGIWVAKQSIGDIHLLPILGGTSLQNGLWRITHYF